MKIEVSNVVAIAPHPDDIELGMGATIHKYNRLGITVRAIILSDASASLPMEYAADDIKRESYTALALLGVRPENIEFLSFPVRRFSEYRQDILETLVRVDRTYSPGIVYCPSLSDTHQDHSVVAQESVRAFRKRTLLGYELPWNNMGFSPTLSMLVSKDDVDKKEESLTRYVSQQGRPYFEPGLLRGLARLRASVSSAEYAEVFEVIRMVVE